MAEYIITADAAGSSKDNDRARNINDVFPFSGGTYRTISSITRRGGVWCSAGGTSQLVTLAVYDQILDGTTVIKTSNTVTCKCYGTGPSSDNYAVTSFSAWTQAESNAAITAWEAGTLVIKRFASVKAYSSTAHGSPVFRDGYYSDVITIGGDTVPFTDYGPIIEVFDVFRSDDGVNENPESTSIYAKVMLGMINAAGFEDSPRLRIYYENGEDPTTDSAYIDIADQFGMTGESLQMEKTVQIEGEWGNGTDYYFLLYFSAGEEIADAKLDVALRASVPLYVAENNNGVAIGQYSNATENAPMFECKWPAYFYGGIAQIGDDESLFIGMTGIQHGQTEEKSVSSGGVTDFSIEFPKAYASPPTVIPALIGDLSGSSAGGLSALVRSVSNTGCVVRVASTVTTYNVAVGWLSVGQIDN